jgi:hypothetical protein
MREAVSSCAAGLQCSRRTREAAVKPRTACDALTEIYCRALDDVSEGSCSPTEDNKQEGLRSFSNRF